MLKFILIMIILCGLFSNGRDFIVWPVVTILALIGTAIVSVILLVGRILFFPFSLYRPHRWMRWHRHLFF